MQTAIEHQALIRGQNTFLRKKSKKADDLQLKSNKKPIKLYKRKILLIEDSEIIQEVEKIYLQGFGCKVDIAKNGQVALKLFKNDYDLILLDIGLPDMSGIDIAKHIRKYESEMSIKRNIIVVLSSNEDNAKECHAVGCDAFHTKPVDMNILENILNQWVPLKRNDS